MGLSAAGAIVLGAALAPTDPVLAGDIGVGPPGEEDEREPNFAVTAEAGPQRWTRLPVRLPRPLPGARRPRRPLARGVAARGRRLRDRGRSRDRRRGRLRSRPPSCVSATGAFLAVELDGWVAVAAVLLVYGAAELAGGYGFLAAFAGGLGFRRYERDHELNERVHDGAEVGRSSLSWLPSSCSGAWSLSRGGPRPAGQAPRWRRSSCWSSARRRGRLCRLGPASEGACFLGWFGVRGVGSVYYAAAAIATGLLAADEAETIFWAVAVCVVASIVAHGITGSIGVRRLAAASPSRAR